MVDETANQTRIWYQSMADLSQIPTYKSALESHLQAVIPPTASATVHGMSAGAYDVFAPIEVLRYPVAYMRILGRIVEAAEEAELRGYTAFIIGSYSEPFLREVRSAVSIPVASMAESTMLVACSVARRFGLVTLTEESRDMAKRLISHHQLGGRSAGVFLMPELLNEHQLAAAFEDPAPVISGFRVAAAQAIESGADVVIPAEGVLNEVLFNAGISDIGGVAAMDCVGITALYAVMLVAAQRTGGLHAGRRWEYPQVPEHLSEALRGSGS